MLKLLSKTKIICQVGTLLKIKVPKGGFRSNAVQKNHFEFPKKPLGEQFLK